MSSLGGAKTALRFPRYLVWAGIWAVLLLPLLAAGQSGPSRQDLVGLWASGEFRSPLMCEIGDQLRPGVRRILIRPLLVPGRPSGLQVQFIDMRVEEATRCIDPLGRPQPNIQGRLELRLPGSTQSDRAMREFKRALQRDKGFQFKIASGSLKVQAVKKPQPEAQVFDLTGGTVELSLIGPGSDAARQLAPFKSERKLLLTIDTEPLSGLMLPLFDPSASGD